MLKLLYENLFDNDPLDFACCETAGKLLARRAICNFRGVIR